MSRSKRPLEPAEASYIIMQKVQGLRPLSATAAFKLAGSSSIPQPSTARETWPMLCNQPIVGYGSDIDGLIRDLLRPRIN